MVARVLSGGTQALKCGFFSWAHLVASLMFPICFPQFRPPQYRANEHARGQLDWNMCTAGMVPGGAARRGWAVSGAEVRSAPIYIYIYIMYMYECMHTVC